MARINLNTEYGKGNVSLISWEEVSKMEYLGKVEFWNPFYNIRIWTDGKSLFTCDKAPSYF